MSVLSWTYGPPRTCIAPTRWWRSPPGPAIRWRGSTPPIRTAFTWRRTAWTADRFRPNHAAKDLRACAERYGLRDPYIAFIGTLQPRKNLGTLAEAFRLARDRGLSHDLAIVGRRGWRYEDIAAQLEGREEAGICLVGAAPPQDLPLLLAGADAFVSVGIDEGFGMPVLEAMASGVPVLASDQAGLADATGDAGLRVDPHDVEAIAAALLRIASDADLRADLRARGLARAADHTWERTARAVWTAMEQACESS